MVLYSDKQMQTLVTAGRIPHASLRSLRSLPACDSATREGSSRDKKADARGEQPQVVRRAINQEQAVEQCGTREEAREEGEQGALDKLGQALLALREAWIAEGGEDTQLPEVLWTGVPP